MSLCTRVGITFAVLILFVSQISFATISATKTSEPTVSIPTTQQNKLQQALNQWREENKLPGVSATIIIPDLEKPLNLVSGTIKLDGKKRVSPKTLFQLCSVTKVYTAALILKLESENKLSISQTVGSWLPQYPKWGDITIKQLLNMTSGIPNYTNDEKFTEIWKKNPTKNWTPAEVLSFVENKSLLYSPGEGWNYDNTNYVLLGMIIEKATGKTYDHVLHEKILHPLNLSHTYYAPYEYTPSMLNQMATGYSESNQDVMNVNMSQAGSAGAIIATTQDAAMFFHYLFAGKILPKAQMIEMQTTYSIKTGKQTVIHGEEIVVGFGMSRCLTPEGYMWYKPGGFVGFLSTVSILDKNKVVIAITTNKDPQSVAMQKDIVPKLYHILGQS